MYVLYQHKYIIVGVEDTPGCFLHSISGYIMKLQYFTNFPPGLSQQSGSRDPFTPMPARR